MTNLSDFLKVKKVRCVNGYGIVHLTEGKEYEIKSLDYISVYGDDGCSVCIDSNRFKPVLDSAENPLQDIELTPEFEAVKPKFKVGDKVYIPNIKNLCTIRNDGKVITSDGQYYCNLSDSHDLCFVLATPENYEMLCKLYPHIEFEAPPKELTGSDLTRAMFYKGWKYVPCFVSNESDDFAQEMKLTDLIFALDGDRSKEFVGDDVWKYAVPIDPRTGEPLTESILND